MTEATKNDEPTTPTPSTEFLAYNIVNQIADVYHEHIPSEKWVEVRQATNDRLWKWTEQMIVNSQPSPSTPNAVPGRVIITRDQIENGVREVFQDEWPEPDNAPALVIAAILARARYLPVIEPTRIEDMAPGTTFRARTKDGVLSAVDRLWFVDATGYVFSIGAHHIDGQRIDPSTIRDITPPPALPNQEDA